MSQLNFKLSPWLLIHRDEPEPVKRCNVCQKPVDDRTAIREGSLEHRDCYWQRMNDSFSNFLRSVSTVE